MADYVGAAGILDEHQGAQPDKPDQPKSTYEPSPEERQAIKLVKKLLDKAKRHRSMYDKDWLDHYRLFRGKQWKESRPSYRHSEVVNLIHRAIQSTVPIQVDARPRIEFTPENPQDQELASILNEVAESDWVRNNWSAELLEVVYDSNIYGTGLSCTKGDDQDGVDYHSVDPVYSYPDPQARDTDKDCEFFIYAEPKDVAWIKRKHPDKAEYIRPDLLDLQKAARAEEDIRFRSPADRNMVMEGTTPLDPTNKDLALYITCYITAEGCAEWWDEEEQPLLDQDGQPMLDEQGQPKSQFVQIARYPKGRKIVLCNEVLLSDEPNPYEDGEIPYERYPNYVMPREFWGQSEVEQLKGPQRIFNKMVSFALDTMTLMGNPIWLVPTTSGVDPDTLVNRPGLNVEFDGEKPPTRVEGVALQPYVLQMIDKMAEWFDSIAGAQDVTRGVNPTGVTAASAISQLQEAAQTRVRQKARNLDYYIQKVGQHWLSRALQYYSAPRIVRITGNQNATRYFQMHVQTYQKDDGTQGQAVHIQPFTDQGQIDPTQLKQYPIRGSFDVRVGTGSTLPFQKAQKQQQLLDYFDRGIIDAEEVLKASEYPNYEQVLQRVQAQQAQAAQQQAAAKAPQAKPAA